MKSRLRLLFCAPVICSLLAAPARARPVIEEGKVSAWSYWTGNGAAPADWNRPGFDDKTWSRGGAPLGMGETRLTTVVTAAEVKTAPRLALFRKAFTIPKLEKGERTVLSLCVDDGAVIYLNGQEVRRMNMPEGAVDAATNAISPLSDFEEGFYNRWTVPSALLKQEAENVIAVEVHQGESESSDLFFDLALRTVAPRDPNPKVNPEAKTVIDAYYKGQFVPPGTKIPDGYLDGGRNMRFDAEGRAVSSREIIVVDRSHDPELERHLAYARSAELKELAPRERAVKLAVYVDKIATPPGGARWTGEAVEQLTEEFLNQPVLMGEIIEQCHAGVCRHRALLFKILADEAGLEAALVRGNLRNSQFRDGYPHAWNEVNAGKGLCLLVDSSWRAGNWNFPDVNDAAIVAEYRKLDNAPLYGTGSGKEPQAKEAP